MLYIFYNSSLILLTYLLIHIIYSKFLIVSIRIGNSFKSYYNLPLKKLFCKSNTRRIMCEYINHFNKGCSATIYNGNRKFPIKTNSIYNIIMTTEKLSQVSFMKQIGEGKNEYYQLAVDYRLFNNKWHISYPIYSTYKYSLDKYIQTAIINYNNFQSFLQRKNIVYLQRASYSNRQFIVKEIMKYINVDSYGVDLCNKEWPINISKRNKIELYKQYKFCIAIENSVVTWKKGSKYEAPKINDDYVTEKLTDCLLAGSIPIYFGPRNINLFIPHPKAIINISNFYSIKELVDYIKEAINDESLLESHLQWHKNISKKWSYRFSSKYSFNYCKICNHVIKYEKLNK